MTIELLVRVEEEIHRVRIDVSRDSDWDNAESVRQFAILTAYLEHWGFIPRGVLGALA